MPNTNKIIVMMRLGNGDDIKVSASVNEKPLGDKEYNVLKRGIETKILPNMEDALYFTVRTVRNFKKDNWKVYSLAELESLLTSIFYGEA